MKKFTWPGWDEWSADERIRFSATMELDRGGDRRYTAARRACGITVEEWETAGRRLIERGVFNRAGAVKLHYEHGYWDDRRIGLNRDCGITQLPEGVGKDCYTYSREPNQ